MDDEPEVEQLENRIEKLESTIEKMMPSRRDALKMGGAALVGGSLMAGAASADTVDDQVGTIGGPNEEVDLVSEDIDNSNQITTQDLVVNGTATGPFGQDAILLESGDNLTLASIHKSTTDEQFVTLYNGPARDVLGGTFGTGATQTDFLYEFSDNSTVTKNSGPGGTSYVRSDFHNYTDSGGDQNSTELLPPAKDVIRIEIGARIFSSSSTLGGHVYLKD